MKTYFKRICDTIIAEELAGMGAVLVQGAKWCGKTTTCEQLAKSALYMADPKKLGGETLITAGVETLRRLAEKIDTTRMKAPSFLMVVVANGEYAYRRSDGIIVCPINCLKP